MNSEDGLWKHISDGKSNNMNSFFRSIKIGIIILTAFILLTAYMCCSIIQNCPTCRRLLGRFTGRSFPPSYSETSDVMLSIVKSFEHNRKRFDNTWPEAGVLADSINGLKLSEKQPYKEHGISVLESRKIPQKILYSNLPFFNSKEIERLEQILDARGKSGSGIVVCCVKAIEQGPEGRYWLYDLDYYDEKGDLPLSFWRVWRVITIYNYDAIVQSDTPPVPGCFQYGPLVSSKEDAFYFPDRVLPIMHDIYPDANVPEENIIRLKNEPNNQSAQKINAL